MINSDGTTAKDYQTIYIGFRGFGKTETIQALADSGTCGASPFSHLLVIDNRLSTSTTFTISEVSTDGETVIRSEGRRVQDRSKRGAAWLAWVDPLDLHLGKNRGIGSGASGRLHSGDRRHKTRMRRIRNVRGFQRESRRMLPCDCLRNNA